MNKVFCPHCGNKTLKKLAVTVSEDGSMQMHFSKNPKVLNSRGLKVRQAHTQTQNCAVQSEVRSPVTITENPAPCSCVGSMLT